MNNVPGISIRRISPSSIVLLSVFLAEILSIGFYYDIHSIAWHGGWLSAYIDHVKTIFPIILIFCVTLILLELPRGRVFSWVPSSALPSTNWQLWLGFNVFTFAAFAFLTATLETPVDSDLNNKSPILANLWVSLIPVIGLFWLRIYAPLAVWVKLIKRKYLTLITASLITALIYLGSSLSQTLWLSFNNLTFTLVHSILTAFYPEVIIDINELILGTPDFQVEITPDCSGYEGIGLVTLFLGLYLTLFRREFKFPHVLILFPIGISVIWLFNVCRIAALVAIGSSWSPEIASHGFHSQAGWITFLLVTFGLIGITGKWSFVKTLPLPIPEANTNGLLGNLSDALILPFVTLIASGILLAVFSSNNGDEYYPVKILATASILWVFRRSYLVFNWQWSWQAVGIGVIVFAVWFFASPNPTTAGDSPEWLVELPISYATLWLGFRVFGSVLIVPMAEELMFRGYVLKKLIAADFEKVSAQQFSWLSFVGSSALFGMLHQRWLVGTLAGMAFAYAQFRQGRMADAVLAHATTNALIAVAVLGFGHWRLWS